MSQKYDRGFISVNHDESHNIEAYQGFELLLYPIPFDHSNPDPHNRADGENDRIRFHSKDPVADHEALKKFLSEMPQRVRCHYSSSFDNLVMDVKVGRKYAFEVDCNERAADDANPLLNSNTDDEVVLKWALGIREKLEAKGYFSLALAGAA